jgi:hypothetical protein
MSNNLIDEAEFLLHLAEENSITRLRNLLQGATAERALPILGVESFIGIQNQWCHAGRTRIHDAPITPITFHLSRSYLLFLIRSKNCRIARLPNDQLGR